MKREQIDEWLEVGMRLAEANGERFEDILRTLQRTADAQEVIASHDHQLILRARRPTKRYIA